MQTEIDAVSVVWFHDRQLRERDWPVMSRGGGASGAWEAIDANHRYNGLLWREAERARRLDVPPAEIAAGQRLIDRYDRKRNDAVESIDKVLLAGLHHVVRRPGARLSSDTAGAIIDRMSGLALHIHHIRGQALPAGADAAHVGACTARLECLLAQRHDLVSRLDRLLAEARAGLAYFTPSRRGRMENHLVLDTCLDRQVRESGRAVP
ncbi:DUF4254 domain-containing protein [Massilia sp. TW-1]|uniref:DUF4254 domain-containing protein n=1 Tax=Telluria antibiotica TaxID=2717319 RepID=A0ABX0PMC1_9BURK|nr:DUF4254 domain-containing protein [Telluria antibiotica]NIA57659.1 DUF4254 domain-containing protein [Telluria antibiotica]